MNVYVLNVDVQTNIMKMNKEIKATETLLRNLNKTYETRPNQTLGSIIVNLEIVLKELIKLNS